MLDVHVIADDQLSVPIVAWTVRRIGDGCPVGAVVLEGGRYRLDAGGRVSWHASLAEARDDAVIAATRNVLVN